jgi:hypothetical protein
MLKDKTKQNYYLLISILVEILNQQTHTNPETSLQSWLTLPGVVLSQTRLSLLCTNTFWTTFSFCSWLCLSFFSSTRRASSNRSSSLSCLISCCRSSMPFPYRNMEVVGQQQQQGNQTPFLQEMIYVSLLKPASIRSRCEDITISL